MPDKPVFDRDALWQLVCGQVRTQQHSVHGPDHWQRVERNGLLLAERTGADIVVVSLFALFHDSRRVNECNDPGHGRRGAVYAANLRGKAFDLTDERFDLLYEACAGHTDQTYHDDPTIGTCWDADRLDLGRVGLVPDPEFMSTSFARQIAARGSIEAFLSDQIGLNL